MQFHFKLFPRKSLAIYLQIHFKYQTALSKLKSFNILHENEFIFMVNFYSAVPLTISASNWIRTLRHLVVTPHNGKKDEDFLRNSILFPVGCFSVFNDTFLCKHVQIIIVNLSTKKTRFSKNHEQRNANSETMRN